MNKSAIALALMSTLCIQSRTSEIPAAKPLFIEIQADGQHCRVRDARVLCSDVLSHLRSVLQLKPGSIVRFKAGRAAPYQSVKRVMDELTNSEYRTPAAIHGPAKPERPQQP